MSVCILVTPNRYLADRFDLIYHSICIVWKRISSYKSVPEQLVSVPEQLVSVPEQLLSVPEQL